MRTIRRNVRSVKRRAYNYLGGAEEARMKRAAGASLKAQRGLTKAISDNDRAYKRYRSASNNLRNAKSIAKNPGGRRLERKQKNAAFAQEARNRAKREWDTTSEKFLKANGKARRAKISYDTAKDEYNKTALARGRRVAKKARNAYGVARRKTRRAVNDGVSTLRRNAEELMVGGRRKVRRRRR